MHADITKVINIVTFRKQRFFKQDMDVLQSNLQQIVSILSKTKTLIIQLDQVTNGT